MLSIISMSAHADTSYPVYNKTGYDIAMQTDSPFHGGLSDIFHIAPNNMHYVPASKTSQNKIMVGVCDEKKDGICISYKKLYKCTPLLLGDEVKSVTVNSLTSCTILCQNYDNKSCVNPWGTAG